MQIPMTVQDLRSRIGRLPRAKLAFLPTPLHEVPRFAQQAISSGARCTPMLAASRGARPV